ncbi:hypothetical protein [Micromonospora sp. NPDC005254]|uniref:hypothetical protein n=1 Tax=Micromonospora sp. NPDC005254 TaxID=3364229 RepID=UPI0036ACDCDF
MSQGTPKPVRPTKRCLDDLNLGFPPLEQALDQLGNPLIVKAQLVPEEVAAGSAERILAIRDRVWFKAKVQSLRGAVTKLDPTGDYGLEIAEASAWWWIGAAGWRQEDSRRDFYRSLAAEVERAGRGSGSGSSEHLLPRDVDVRRLRAEVAVQVTLVIKKIVRKAIAASMKTGKVCTATFSHHRVSALVRARDGEAYLAVTAEGFVDPRLLAVILGAVPHVSGSDWLPEPEGVFGIRPEPGQIIYSAIISANSQAEIMDELSDDDSQELDRP